MPRPKKFLNDPADAVDEYVAGLLLQYPNHLRKLAGHNVVLHGSFGDEEHPNLGRVSILSGGGSGHEPAHAGYIGENMLSGAILGGIFASPAVAAILSAIRAVTLPTARGGKGCLLIVKNYTGDRLNFGMARELAAAEGYGVSMVVVADDCALPRTKGITGARGVAGTVLVHKAAGGKAGEDGAGLADVTAAAEAVSDGVSTMGVALSAVTVPGAEEANDRLDGPDMEVGLGIHGEAGARQCPLASCDGIAGEMLDAIQSYGRIGPDGESVVPLYGKGDELLVLVNNLGGTSNFEMSLLARSVVSRLEDADGCVVSRVLVGSFMTSFDMQGASVSVLPLRDVTEDIVALLDKETTAPAWVGCDVLENGKARPSSSEIPEVAAAAAPGTASGPAQLPPVEVEDFADLARAALAACSAALAEAEPLLTKYDTIVGDGDCGLTMKRGADEVASRLAAGSLRLGHPSTAFADLADAVSSSMGGTSGILLELMFRKIGVALSSSPSGGGIAAADMAEAFKAGVEAVSFYGGAQEGSRTMLDALFPASSALTGGDGSVSAAAVAARKGADGTAAMDHAEAGRSNYLSEDVLRGTPDPGAVAVAIVFETLAK